MHAHCLSCSAELGRNDSIEAFPLGRRLAFDAWKGRLWVVCRSCHRWNLVPIEERWEPVEALERLFRDSRTRVQAENIGLARLPDGTTLVRIGRALEGELAAWRYGDELRRRRWKGILAAGATIGGAVALWTLGQGAAASIVSPFAFQLLWNGGNAAMQYRLQRRVVHLVPAADSPTGSDILIRRMHLFGAVLSRTKSSEPTLLLPLALETRRRKLVAHSLGLGSPLGASAMARTPPLVLHGEAVRRVAGRALVTSNVYGASNTQVHGALGLIEAAGGADAYVRAVAEGDSALPVRRPGYLAVTKPFRPRVWDRQEDLERLPMAFQSQLGAGGPHMLDRVHTIALEMALHEERERRALEGELALLEDEWKEAEMLATIADALPGEPMAGP